MGATKEQLHQIQDERFKKMLAEMLGLERDDVDELTWEVNPIQDNDDAIRAYEVVLGEDSNPDVIQKIPHLYNGNTIVIDAWVLDDGLNYDELDWLTQSSERYKIFEKHMLGAAHIATVHIDPNTYHQLLVMLFAHVVASTEAFLSSTYIYHVLQSPERVRKVVETSEHFKKAKFPLAQLFDEHDKINSTVAKHLNDFIFHKIHIVKPMYKATFNIDLGDIEWLAKAIHLRHDCVHRAGYTKGGTSLELTNETVLELIDKCKSLCFDIENHF
jgi:hypothetical protein